MWNPTLVKIQNMWKAETRILIGNSSSNPQMLEGNNTLVADRLADLAKEEISKFFRLLQNPDTAARGEVSHLC